jgi:hypothetical protein
MEGTPMAVPLPDNVVDFEQARQRLQAKPRGLKKAKPPDSKAEPHDAVYERECIEDLTLMADGLFEIAQGWPLPQVRKQFLAVIEVLSQLRGLYEQRLEARSRGKSA